MRILILILVALGLFAPPGVGAPSGKPGAERSLPMQGPPAPGSAEAQRAKLEQLRMALAEGRFAVPVEAVASSRPLPRAIAAPKLPEVMTAEPLFGPLLEQALRRQQEKLDALGLRPPAAAAAGSRGHAVSPDQAALKSGAYPLVRPLPAGPLTPAQRAKLSQVQAPATAPAPAAGADK